MNPRLGRCYELSYKYATSHPEWTLVHGYITNMDGSKTIDHAWVEDKGGEVVFDPVMDQELPVQVYYAMFRAEPFKRYSFDETLDKAMETEVYGPWHDHPKGKVRFPESVALKSAIRESLAPVVYHATFIGKFLEILRSNSFFLSSSLGSKADRVSKKYHYFMSFSRVKFGGFSRMKEAPGQVTLVVDGKKLNERYKGVSLDYWGRDFSKDAEPEAKWKFDENEDRLLANVPEIKDALSYIKEAHVLIGTENRGKEAVSSLADTDYPLYQSVREACNIAKNFGLTIYFYDDVQSYRAQNKKRAVYVTKEDVGYVTAFLRVVAANDKDDLSVIPREWPYDRVVDALLYGDHVQDLVTQLENDAHNSRNDPLMRGAIGKLTALIRRMKADDIQDLVKKLREKESA